MLIDLSNFITSPRNCLPIKAIYSKWLCPIGFGAITLFGKVYTRNKEFANKMNDHMTVTGYHETIHVYQAINTLNSWFIFYLLYILMWIMNLPLLFVFPLAPYRFIPFEMEAFAYQKNFDYLSSKYTHGCSMWKKYFKLSLIKKWKYARDFKKHGSDYGYYVLYNINKEENF